MPTQTFFNLPESKREALLELAIDEFANNDYRNASISRIVARAGIAKGSIYQYFADKQELFMYLLELATQEKMAFLKRNPPPDGMDFFTYLRWMASLGARSALAHPRLAQVAYRALYGDLPFRDEVLARVREASHQYVAHLVRDAIARGDIDPEIEPEMATFVISTLINELANYLFRRLGVDPAQVGREGLLEFDAAVVEQVFDEFTRTLRDGLGNKARTPAQAEGNGLVAARDETV
jgi:AcrR family transcriptional regulator